MAKHKNAEHAPAAEPVAQKLSRKDYDQELERLHIELVKLQQWVVAKGLKVVVVFEGRDGDVFLHHRLDLCGRGDRE